MGFINGQMEGNILGIGKLTLWMTLEYILGKMEECMRVITKKIKNTALVFISGLILNNTLAGGLTANSMDWEFSCLKMENLNMVYGKMAKN